LARAGCSFLRMRQPRIANARIAPTQTVRMPSTKLDPGYHRNVTPAKQVHKSRPRRCWQTRITESRAGPQVSSRARRKLLHRCRHYGMPVRGDSAASTNPRRRSTRASTRYGNTLRRLITTLHFKLGDFPACVCVGRSIAFVGSRPAMLGFCGRICSLIGSPQSSG
jgi:hypothetical protein